MRPTATTGAIVTAESRTLTFDCTLKEQAQNTAQVTSHEVEDGAPITDHVRPQPVRLTLQVVASTAPLRDTPDPQRDRKFRQDVLEIYHGRELCEVVCEAGVFSNMVISQIDDPIDASTGEAMVASITWQEIRRAVRVVTLVPPDPADERRAQRARDAGGQAGAPADATDTAAAAALGRDSNSTTLYQISGGSDEAVLANIEGLGGALQGVGGALRSGFSAVLGAP